MARRRRHLDDDVPRIPRSKGFSVSSGQLVRILMVAAALVALVALQRPCSKAVGKFVTSFDDQDAGLARDGGADASAAVTPTGFDGVSLKGMTQAQMEAAVKAELEAARAREAAAADAGAATDAGARPR